MQTVITSKELENNPVAKIVVNHFSFLAKQRSWEDTDAVLYFGFPKFHGYDETTTFPDLIFLSRNYGLLALRFEALTDDSDSDVIEEQLDELHSLIFSKLYESKHLRLKKKRVQELIFPIEAYAYTEVDVIGHSFADLFLNCCEDIETTLAAMQTTVPLTEFEFNECRSIIEGTKALSAQVQREINADDTSSKAFILSRLEDEIKNFDFEQRASAISIIEGPQRIRGLAGSGKTVVLAMKAAHIHLSEPDKRILFTFYTKSLYEHVKNLITRFYRHFKKEDPNWENLHIKHSWGGSGMDGVYYSACEYNGIVPLKFPEAKKANPSNPFDYVCEQALKSSQKIRPQYDYILMDEAQDMPVQFFRLVYKLAKGQTDEKNIIWGYDELQNIFKVKTRSPKQLFGTDENGLDFVDLDRSSANIPRYLENDIVLKKCYRNPRDVLIAAHAIGFGIYKQDNKPVQGLEDAEHWQDLGYEVLDGDFKIGTHVTVERPEKNSPLSILNFENREEIIQHYAASNMDTEVQWVTLQIKQFIDGGLKAEDILVIALDDIRARQYFAGLTDALSIEGIRSNNILLNPYNATYFIRKNMVTLSTIHRAKGNEAPAVIVIGIDAMYATRNSRFSRNRIFTAFTRAKAWLRISGVGNSARYFFDELEIALKNSPRLEFTHLDPEEIETIQRDLSDKKKNMKALREQMNEQLDMLNLSEDEKREFYEGKL